MLDQYTRKYRAEKTPYSDGFHVEQQSKDIFAEVSGT